MKGWEWPSPKQSKNLMFDADGHIEPVKSAFDGAV